MALKTIVSKLEEMEAEIERLAALEFMMRSASQTAWGRQNAIFLGLPFLRGFWPHGAYQTSNVITDFGGLDMDLTMNSGTRPLMTLSGVDSQAPACFYLSANFNYASHVNHGQLNVAGNESDVDSGFRGLTIGAWVNPTTITGTRPVVGKWQITLGKRQYLLSVNSSKAQFEISNNGTTVYTVSSAGAITASSWSLLIGRFDPSTEISILMNGVEAVNTTSIPATLYLDTGSFETGSYLDLSRSHFNGLIGPVFLCGGLLNDAVCNNLFETTRGLYGV